MDLCRTCLEQSSNLVSVESTVINNLDVMQAIEELACFQQAYEAYLPKFICGECFEQLTSSVVFKRMIIESQTKLIKNLKEDAVATEEGVDEKTPVVDNALSSSEEIEIKKEESPENCESKKIQKNNVQNNIDQKSNKADKTIVKIETEKTDEIIISKENPDIILQKLQTGKTCNSKIQTKKKYHSKVKNIILTCAVCGTQLQGRKEYKQHIKSHNYDIDGPPPLSYTCSVCPKRYQKREYLLIHMRSHTGERPYQCEICNKNFSQLSTYYVHRRRVHEKVVKATCNYCGKNFVDKADLDGHIKLYHTGERPYLCEFCSAGFVSNRSLQRHRKEIHSEKKPCHKCGKMLGDYALRKHLVRHQILEGSLKIDRKKYKCEFCKSVMNFTSRRRHLERQHGIKLQGRGGDGLKASEESNQSEPLIE